MDEKSLADLAAAVAEARTERGWSVEEAARRAKINRVTWKRIEDAQPVQDVKRRAAERLLAIGDQQIPQDRGASAAEIAAEQLNPDLADFTDRELMAEIEARMMVMAAELHAAGKRGLSVMIDPDGRRRITSSYRK